jgi:hypothetical protein
MQTSENMAFERALVGLKDGFRLSRLGWGDSYICLCVVSGMRFMRVERGELIPYGDYIGMVTEDGVFVPWSASHADLLASDWFVVQN